MEKIISYLGFAIKAKKYIAGQTAIKKSKEKINLILVSYDASENLKDLAQNVAKIKSCEVINCKVSLSELTHIQDIKIIAIQDENIAKAIIENKEKIIG